MPLKLSAKDRDYAQKLDLLLKQVRAETQDVVDVVSDIIDDVRRNGDAALIALTKKFDSIDLAEKGFRVSLEEIQDAKGNISKEELTALKLAAKRIESFHANQKPKDLSYIDEQGVGLGSVSYTHLTLPTILLV